uniref:Uncharacterized protein n=1 Tax=Rhizophora mucronata TaxID=61149 RepID=A0A2P2JQ35_RHIMU
MAHNFVPFVTALFFFFALTHASQLDLPENVTVTPHENLPEPISKDKNSILLPSERSDFESVTVAEVESVPVAEVESVPVAEVEPEKKPVNLPKTVETTEVRLESETQTVPLTFVSFRPINRHFPRRSFIPFFGRGHRCRHHHHHRRFPKPLGPRFEIPYGDDMILSGEGDRSFDPMSRGGARQIPGRWASFRHDGPRFWDMPDVAEREEMKWKRPYPHEHHWFDEERKQEEGGLLEKIRKFLDHF